MRPRDTDKASHQAQVEAIRALGGDGRLAQGAQLSEAVREMTVQGIRERHPHFTEPQVIHELIRLLYGDELAKRVADQRASK